MASEPAERPHLHVVEDRIVAFDSSTGEICPNCDLALKDRDAADMEVRRLRRLLREAREDKEAKVEEHELFPKAKRAFAHWKIVCHHRRSAFLIGRFEAVEPFLRKAKTYGEEIVLRAIDGAAFQSWVSERSNGSLKIHNDWNSIFADGDSIEERANRAPQGWSLRVSAEMENWNFVKPAVPKSWHGIHPPAGWEPPTAADSAGQTSLLGG